MADAVGLSLLTADSGYKAFTMRVDTGFFQTENTFQFLSAADNQDLFVIKKAGTDSNSTEVHILSADSNYQSYSLQTGTALGETDNTWTFGLASNRDLFAIKRFNNTSRSTEVNVLTKLSNYKYFSVRAQATALHETDYTWQFLVGVNDDVYVIKKQRTGSNRTEVHVLDASSNYQSFSLQVGSGLMETDLKWDFFGLDSSHNIYAIHRTSAAPELYILNSASQYKTFVKISLQLPDTDHRYAFVLAQTLWRNSSDVLALKKSHTSSGFMEVTLLSSAQNRTRLQGLTRYQAYAAEPMPRRSCLAITDGLCDFSWATYEQAPEQHLCIMKKNHNSSGFAEVLFLRELNNFKIPSQRIVTSWPLSDNTCEFHLTKSWDLLVIKKSRTGTHKTEVHIMEWPLLQRYALQTGTFLHETDNTWTFVLAENLDVIAIHKSNTFSRKTEYVELLREGNYQNYSPKLSTCLDETDDSWEFLLAPNRDLYAIQKYGTSSGYTEIKVLSAASKYKEFKSKFQTALPQTDYNFSFCLTPDRGLVAIQKSRFPFSANLAPS